MNFILINIYYISDEKNTGNNQIMETERIQINVNYGLWWILIFFEVIMIYNDTKKTVGHQWTQDPVIR